MSKDKEDTSNIVDDDVQETNVWRVKKDAHYVASSDVSKLIITTVQLKENKKDNKYAEWAKEMCLALRSKKKLGFIDGLTPIPKDDPNKEEEWWKINTLVNFWILNTFESSQDLL